MAAQIGACDFEADVTNDGTQLRFGSDLSGPVLRKDSEGSVMRTRHNSEVALVERQDVVAAVARGQNNN